MATPQAASSAQAKPSRQLTKQPGRHAVASTSSPVAADGLDLGGLDLSMLPPAAGVPAKGKPKTINAVDHLPQLNKKISQLLAEKIPRQPVNGLYKLGIAGMALFMMIMPLAYFTLIGVVAYGVYHYTFGIFPGLFETMPRGRAAIFAVMMYGAPIVAGVITVIFMIKPVFTSLVFDGDARQRSLRRETEPALFHLVDQICESVSAPKPKRIDVDCDVNASASFGTGFKGLFGNDLVLTIGVPLVADMSARQFSGVLAHEFGHFSQGAGMRSSAIVRSINFWFFRVVYQRDGIDEMLDESMAESESVGISLVLGLASLCVWITRRILWCFMMVSHLVSSFMLRQMEFDADRFEAGLGGSKSFIEASHRLRLLGFSQGKTMAGLSNLAAKESVLVDNIPMMIAQVRRARDRPPAGTPQRPGGRAPHHRRNGNDPRRRAGRRAVRSCHRRHRRRGHHHPGDRAVRGGVP
ncbi:MAG: M48 family metallopeptidase, partial [Planctomycetota bacterium]